MVDRAKELVETLLSNSNFLDSLANAVTSTNVVPPSHSFRRPENEVHSLFNRGPQSSDPANVLINARRTNIMQDFSIAPSSSGPPYNLRPFPRPSCIGRRQTRRGPGLPAHETFTKEVVLLPDNETTSVPRRASKAWLYEHGHVKSALEFNISWTQVEVMAAIKKAFMPQAEDFSFQLVIGCHSKLVQPSLSQHQEMTSYMLKRVFHQRTVYVRPDRVLLQPSPCVSEEENSVDDANPGICSNENRTVVQQDVEVPLESERVRLPNERLREEVLEECNRERVSPRRETERISPRSETERISPRSETERISPRSETERISPRSETERISPRSETERISPRSETERISPRSETECFFSNETEILALEQNEVVFLSDTRESEAGGAGTLYSEYVNLLGSEEYEQDESLQEAIANSLSDTTFPTVSSSEHPTTQDIIRGLSCQINEDKVIRFNIIRRNVWDGATRAMLRPNFSPEKVIDVKFTDDYGTSEGAVDNGGPKREFFRLCLLAIKDECGIFEGPDDSKSLACNSKAMKSNWYFLAGQLMAMSIVHGGQSPCFLSSKLFECLVRGPDHVKISVSDVYDPETSFFLKAIKDAETDADLQTAVTAASCVLMLAGCNRKITITNKEEVSTELAEWCVLHRTRAPFERLSEGLRTLGVLEALQQFPEKFREIFMRADISLTAEKLEEIFTCILADKGTNRFERECRTLCFWRDYLQDAEFGTDRVTLEEILIFATGCDSVPALGFSPTPTLGFVEHSAYPIANTCDNILRIPIQNSYAEFQAAMNFGIRNSAGFGKA